LGDVCSAGAVGIGFGVGTPNVSVPEALIEACQRQDFPLFEVPEDVSFATISAAVATRVAHGAEVALRRHLIRTRSLWEALATGEGHGALLELLHRETGLGAALVGPGGRLLARVGRRTTQAEASDAERLARARRLPSQVGSRASAFDASTSWPPRCTLIVLAPLREIGDDLRVVIDQIRAYAALEDARQQAREDTLLPLAQELVTLLRAGELGEASFRARMDSLQLNPDAPYVALASPLRLPLLRYGLETVGWRHVVARHCDDTIAFVAPEDDETPLARLAETIEKLGEEPVLGGGRRAEGREDLRRSLAEALYALDLARARQPGARVIDHVELGSHAALLDLLDPYVLRQFRETVLGSVERWDIEHDTDLTGTLRAFLESGGRWRATARLLHVHHNTLRHRMKRIEGLTGRAIMSTRDRVDFQLALSIRSDESPAAR
jgi:hypothetical protein